MNIDRVYRIVEFVRNKGQGRYYSPEEIGEVVNQVQVDLFNREYSIFERSNKVSDMLRPFLNRAELSLVQGKAVLPSDYVHWTDTWIDKPDGSKSKAKKLTSMEYGDAISSSAFPPTIDFPACYIQQDYIEFLPNIAEKGYISYLRLPNDAVWAYTLPDGRTPVFDSASSTDLEWSGRAVTEIIFMTLQYLGYSYRDADLAQFGIAKEQLDMPKTDR